MLVRGCLWGVDLQVTRNSTLRSTSRRSISSIRLVKRPVLMTECWWVPLSFCFAFLLFFFLAFLLFCFFVFFPLFDLEVGGWVFLSQKQKTKKKPGPHGRVVGSGLGTNKTCCQGEYFQPLTELPIFLTMIKRVLHQLRMTSKCLHKDHWNHSSILRRSISGPHFVWPHLTTKQPSLFEVDPIWLGLCKNNSVMTGGLSTIELVHGSLSQESLQGKFGLLWVSSGAQWSASDCFRPGDSTRYEFLLWHASILIAVSSDSS